MELFLIAAALTGNAAIAVAVYLAGVLAVSALVLPKARKVGQSLRPWIVSTLLFPLVTYAFVRKRLR